MKLFGMNSEIPAFLRRGGDWEHPNAIMEPYLKYTEHNSGSNKVSYTLEMQFHLYKKHIPTPNSYVSINFSMDLGDTIGHFVERMEHGMFLDGLLHLCGKLEDLPPLTTKPENEVSTLVYGYRGRKKKLYTWDRSIHENSIFAAIEVMVNVLVFDYISMWDSPVFSETTITFVDKESGETKVMFQK